MDYMEQAERLARTYADPILRLSYTYLKNTHDAQDICQTVFVKLLTEPREFESPEHERAYILRMAANACKDLLRSFFRSRTVPLEQLVEVPQPFEPDERDLLEAVLALPAQYKDVVYLYYYEQYTALEIAQILHKNVNTVYTLLRRARERLRKDLEGVMEVE